MSPRDLLAAGRTEVEGYGGVVLPGTATRMARTATGFEVLLTEGTWLYARGLLVATGLVDVLPDIPACGRASAAAFCTARIATATR